LRRVKTKIEEGADMGSQGRQARFSKAPGGAG